MSPSSLPPRLRDTKALDDLVRQEKINLRQLDVGFAGGRFSPLRPRKFFPDQDEDDEDFDNTVTIAFCNTDRTVASGPGDVRITLSHTPIDGSLHIRWDGDDQPPTEWTLVDNLVTIPDPDRLVESGDVFSAAYAYEFDDYEHDIVPFTYVAGRGYQTAMGTSPLTSLALPGGTQAGDTVILATIGGFDSAVSGSYDGYAHVTDGRFAQAWSGIFCSRTALVHSAVVGSDLSDIQMSVKGDSGTAFGQYIGLMAITIRGTTGPVTVDTSRVAASDSGTNRTLPALGGGGSGAIGILLRCAGIGGVHPASAPLPYTFRAATGVYTGPTIWTSEEETVEAVATTCSDFSQAITVGLGYDS